MSKNETKKNNAAEAPATPADDVMQGATTEEPAAPAEELVRVTAKRLNLRQGPSRDFAVKAVLDEGTVAAVLDLPMGTEVPGWALVHVSDELIGWVDIVHIQAVEE